MGLSAEELAAFVAELVASPELWRTHIRPAGRDRAFALIWADEQVNAWVICWSEDHDTGFHDHDESAAAVAVVEGEVREERLRLAARPAGRTLGAGATFTVPATAIHRVVHSGEGPAVTIHAYSPPLRRVGAYEIGPDGELERFAADAATELRAESGALTG